MARRNLDSYPRPGVTVDLAILTVTDPGTDDAALRVLVQERTDPDGRVLPGRFLRERHTIDETVREVFEHKVGESGLRGRTTVYDAGLAVLARKGQRQRTVTQVVGKVLRLLLGEVAGDGGRGPDRVAP